MAIFDSLDQRLLIKKKDSGYEKLYSKTMFDNLNEKASGFNGFGSVQVLYK